MKTLEEVIAGMTELILSGKTDDVKYVLTDALHYLKELRHILNNTIWVGSTKEENGYWKLPTLPETGNDPLTWGELQQMEGKPVWIEELDYSKRWYGFWDVISDTEDYGDEKFVYVKSEMRYEMDEYGKTWQAYRKERG